MKQKLINGLVITIILFFALSIVGILVLDGLAQSIIQTKGSEGLGTTIKFDSVHVGFFSDDSGFKGLSIANPPPFYSEDSPTLLTIKEGSIDFGVMRLLEKTVELPTASATGVVLTLQQKNNETNIELVIQNISNDKTPEASHPEPTFNIQTMTIKDITVFASGAFTVVTDKIVEAKIEEIVLHNIGTDGDAEVATEAITSAVTHAIMQHLEHHPVEGFSKLAFTNVTNAINKLPVFHQLGIGSAIQGVTDKIGTGVDNILNIFNNPNKED